MNKKKPNLNLKGERIMKKTEFISDKNNGLDYTRVGEVYLPNLISTETNYEIGLWGCGCPGDTSAASRSTDRADRRDQRHLRYIKQHRKVFYTSLLTNSKLNSYLHDVDVRATEMYNRIVKQLKEQQGITEQLKADDMMAWVQAMNNITNQAREVVNTEVIYTV